MKVGSGKPSVDPGGKKEVHKKPQLALDSVFKKQRSGLEIYVEKYGKGPKAEKGKEITVHYEGFLAEDYKKFDSSRDKKRPFKLTLGKGEVIQGWEDALKGVKEGSKLQLKIPASLAYGPTGFPGAGVPPNADLIFKVEIMRIKDAPDSK